MERLKSAVPAELRRAVGEGTAGDLPCTTSRLLAFLDGLPLFHQVEDTIAEAFAKVGGDQEQARKHWEASIKILEKLYHPNHIIIAHELIKLVSIDLSLGDGASAAAALARAEAIFLLYYGPDVKRILPYVDVLRRTVTK
ncbi:hypothetical protein ABZP36_010633 [Zizania latifolia]